MVSTCPACFTKIEDQSWVVYSNAKYHTRCFTCNTCERGIGPDEVFRHNGGLRTCVDCAKKEDPSIGEDKVCYGCDIAIDKAWVIGLDQKWHAECFTCCECKRVIDPTERFYRVEVEDKILPKCTDCRTVTSGMASLDVKDKKCPGCNEEITGSWLTAMDAHWHKTCFTCSHCDQSIVQKSFIVKDDKPVCMDCNNEHFRRRCKVCEQPIEGQSLIYEDSAYHYSCVKCYKCDVAFENGDHANIRITSGKDFKHADC